MLALAIIFWVLLAGFAGGLAGLGLAAFGSPTAIAAIAVAYTVAAVTFCARTFRGAQEPSAPRPWWKLTASPISSAVWVVVSVGGAAQTALTPPGAGQPSEPLTWVLTSVITSLLVAVAFAHSAIRLLQERRTSSAASV